MKNVHIGSIIKQKVKEKSMTNKEFADRINCERTNVYHIFKQKSIDIDKNAKDWTILLTTDLSLSFVKAMELYQIRWSIEVLFKECKQYLRLGKSQNTDFCGQIADATMTMITYTILTLYKRFESYETLGALFRDTQKEMIEKTLCERIEMVILKILRDLLEILSINVEETLHHLMSSDKSVDKIIILLNAVNQFYRNNGESSNAA